MNMFVFGELMLFDKANKYNHTYTKNAAYNIMMDININKNGNIYGYYFNDKKELTNDEILYPKREDSLFKIENAWMREKNHSLLITALISSKPKGIELQKKIKKGNMKFFIIGTANSSDSKKNVFDGFDLTGVGITSMSYYKNILPVKIIK